MSAMTDARRTLAVLASLAALAVLATGCGDDEPTLLQGDDLPSDVESSKTGTAGFFAVGNCSGVNDAQGRASTQAWADDGFRYWIYTLDSGDSVSAAVLDFQDADATEAALADIAEERDACAEHSAVGIVTEPLDDLPDGAVGYRVTTPTSSGDRIGEFVIAPADEADQLVAVGTSRLHGEEPETDLLELLAAAQKRAPDADLESKDDAA